MSYLVLARKHRPKNFDEVIGQEHICKLLKKAIESDRIAHSYLFSGPRGVGKTSCARILAKSLNCEKGPTLKPCEECSACKEIATGMSFDVLEIDGASNRGIDEIRALRENVKFAPAYGRYKIYIIDEVHMLTMEAFNALLKTLEEPPEHVKFIFATTAPHKLPATIISRCQRFDFKRIPLKVTVDVLTSIAKKEKLKVEQDALFAIAKASQGSLRDALSTLDQLSSLSDQMIASQDVYAMLGLVETKLLFDLVDALGRKDCVVALEVLERVIDQGKDIKQLYKDITEHFRNLMILKIGGKALGRLVDYPIAIKELFLKQCDHFTLKEILTSIETFIDAQETSRITDSMRMPLEVAFAQLTYQPEQQAIQSKESLKSPVQAGVEDERSAVTKASDPSAQLPRNKKGQLDITATDLSEDGEGDEEIEKDNRDTETGESPQMESTVAALHLNIDKIAKTWDALTYAVSRIRMSVATYLQEGTPVSFHEGTLTVGFPKKSTFQKETLETQDNMKLVEKVLSGKLKTDIFVKYTIVDSVMTKHEAPIVKAALETFDGKVVNQWHED